MSGINCKNNLGDLYCRDIRDVQETLFDFRLLQQALRDGTAEELYPVGCWLADTFEGQYNPLRIVDYREVLLPGGARKQAAILLRAFAIRHRMAFGDRLEPNIGSKWCSDYAHSAVRQYLNYTGDDKEWYRPYFKNWFAELEYYTSVRPYGYLHGCSASLREAISPIIITTPTFDEHGRKDGVSKTDDLTFLLSCENMGYDLGNNVDLERMTLQWFSKQQQRAREYEANAKPCRSARTGRMVQPAYRYEAYFEPNGDRREHTICWTRSSIPVFGAPYFGASKQYRYTGVYAVNRKREIVAYEPDARLCILPAHAIVG